MKSTHLLVALLLASSPAAAQSTAEQTGVNATLGISPSTADFITKAAISDMFELESSELASQRGSAATKAFAADMITAHRKTSEQLKALVGTGKAEGTIPVALDEEHQEELADLEKLNGPDFDKEYRDDQIDAHEAAVSLFER